MGLFGKSKEDTSQDAAIKEIWKWITALNKNQAVLIKNNEYFVKRDKQNTTTLQQLTEAINALVAKDKQHDAKDREIEAVIQGLKDMSVAVEKAVEEEG